MADPGVVPRIGRRDGILLGLLVAIYLAVTLLTLAVWSARGVYTVTGDEPHYLLIADGLMRFGSLEMSRPYAEEFVSHAIYSLGLAPAGSVPMAPFAHVVAGANGLFSWHGPGIAFLVAVPFALFGVMGAKLVMVALGALIVIVVWRVAGVFATDPWIRFASTLVVAIAYPLVPAATQIYPDMVAGLLALSGIYYLLSADRPRRAASLAGYSFVVGYLPWLGTKFAITSIILLAAMAWFTYRSSRSRSRLAWILLPAVASFLVLAITNLTAFGRVTGPAVEGALEVSSTSFMVLGGLLLDQDQGILLQNPVLWVGLFGLAGFIARYRAVAVVWSLVFVSIWLPSAMHPGWYGLGSFVGRYSWALAVLFTVPALLGLALIAEWSRRVFWVIVGAGVAIHLAFFAVTTFVGGSAPGAPAGLDLYTKDPSTWLESYAIFAFPLQNWLPALYNISWAGGFWTNPLWFLLFAAVILIGVRPRIGLLAAAVCLVVIAGAGFVAQPGPRSEVLVASSRSTAAGSGSAGYLSTGLVQEMRQGPYTWSVTYAAAGSPQTVVGKWELVSVATDAVVAAGELAGTSGTVTTVPIAVPYLSLQPREFVLRVATYGVGQMRVDSTGVRHGSV